MIGSSRRARPAAGLAVTRGQSRHWHYAQRDFVLDDPTSPASEPKELAGKYHSEPSRDDFTELACKYHSEPSWDDFTELTGKYHSEPLWDDFMEAIRENRREVNEQQDPAE